VIRGERGTRTVAMREFFLGPYQTAVAPAEILVELRVPLWATGSAYVKVDRRAGDWAVAAAAAALRVADGVITDAGIGLTAVGPFVAAEAEASLIGRPPGEEVFTEAGRLAAAHCRPVADQRRDQAPPAGITSPASRRAVSPKDLVSHRRRQQTGRAARRRAPALLAPPP
jgi:carbon-monoxide dehydrogenase medium subunit